MAVSIRKVTLWRTEVEHRPGALADLLEPLAAAGADLQIVMGYRIPGHKGRAVIEVAPVGNRKVARAAEEGGLAPGGAPTLLVLGDNRPGLANRIAGRSPRAASPSRSWSRRWWADATPPCSASRARAISTRPPTASGPR